MARALELPAGIPAPSIGMPALAVTLIIWMVVQATLATFIPLFQDEAYYALWATRLAVDYYDHPPMIAVWIWLGERIAGHTPLGVRLLPLLAMALVPAMCWRIAERLTGAARTARIAALVAATMTLSIFLGFSATPDQPSVFFWTLASLALIEATRPAGGRVGWFALCGLAAGLGVLSKFTNLFFIGGAGLWLIASREGRRTLAGPGPWMAGGIALLVLLPLLIWNAQHDWFGFRHQFGRLAAGADPHPAIGAYLGLLVVAITPPFLWFLSLGTIRTTGPARLLLWINAPLLIYFLLHATHAQVQANWIAPVFPGIAVLCAIGAGQSRNLPIALSAGFSGLLTLAALGLALWPGRPVFPGDNPPNQTKGWADLSAEIATLAQKNGASWIATTDYGVTGELAFHLPGVSVWSLTDGFRYGFRGAMPQGLCGQPAILVENLRDPSAAPLFQVAGTPITLDRASRAVPIASYRATSVRHLTRCN